MLKDTLITKKFPLIMIVFAIVSAIATGIIALQNAEDGLIHAYENKVSALLEAKRSSVKTYADTIKNDITYHAQASLVVDALKEFSINWDLIKGNKSQYLKEEYINKNPFSPKLRSSFLQSLDNNKYNSTHGYYHPKFRNLINARSFHDLFLINVNGDVLYTVTKENDYASNLITGHWKDSGLARMFSQIKTSPVKGNITYIDFEAYGPSNNQIASFIGSPVFDKGSNFIGVIGFQMPIKPLDKIMQHTAGMGKTGETYLVGPDKFMRSNSRFFPDSSILRIKVDTGSVKKAMEGETGIAIQNDYRDISVLSAYSPITFFGTNWSLLAEIDYEEVLTPVYKMRNYLLFSSFFIILVISVFGYLIANDIAHPIVTMANIMSRLADNKLDTNISVSLRKDEVGLMAEAMKTFKKNAVERQAFHVKLSHLANHDPLTDLPSRKYALDKLDKLIGEAKINNTELAIIFVDLDNFKNINDTFGHSEGDKVLIDVAKKFKSILKDTDIPARLGGDEFIIICPNIPNIDYVTNIAEAILLSIDNEIETPDLGSKSLSASIGISIYPRSALTAPQLIKKADESMYEAKHSGKNQFIIMSK